MYVLCLAYMYVQQVYLTRLCCIIQTQNDIPVLPCNTDRSQANNQNANQNASYANRSNDRQKEN
jgi:hypothetical protein